MNTELFVKKSKAIHGDRYNYTLVNYINSKTKVTIICEEHGEFMQRPDIHIGGGNCQLCSNKKGKTRDGYIEEFILKHGNKYDYSNFNYTNVSDKITIICKEHGEFKQRCASHLKGSGCPKCALEKISKSQSHNNDKFIEKSKTLFGDKYDYSLVNYVNKNTLINIICPIHGKFFITPTRHYKLLNGCPKCGENEKSKNSRLTKEKFIERSKEKFPNIYDYSLVDYKGKVKPLKLILRESQEIFEITPMTHLNNKTGYNVGESFVNTQEKFISSSLKKHGNKYDYSLVVFSGIREKVKIICPEHGLFKQVAESHLNSLGCPQCGNIQGGKNNRLSQEDFLKKSIEKHGDRYDYSLSQYILSVNKVKIICPKHGIFEQTPSHHMNGVGCPFCKLFKQEEKLLKKLKEVFNGEKELVFQYRDSFLRRINTGGSMSLDFYLPDYKIGIEYQGVQHFSPVEIFGGDKGLKETKNRDKIKKEKCEDNGIELLYFTFNKKHIPVGGYSLGYVYSDFDELINYIKNK